MNRRVHMRTLIVGAAIGGVTAAGAVTLHRALAQPPTTLPPLYYSGVLEEGGQLVDDMGPRGVVVQLFQSSQGGDAVCTTGSSASPAIVSVDRGRFNLELDPLCSEAATRDPELWVEVTISGSKFARTRLGAVPYALNSTPLGAVMFFNLGVCPPGWSPYLPAVGRSIVGMATGGKLGGQSASAPLTDLETRPHTHGFQHQHGVSGRTDDGAWSSRAPFRCCGADRSGGFVIDVDGSDESWGLNTYGFSATSDGASRVDTDPVDTTIPYVQLLACQRD